MTKIVGLCTSSLATVIVFTGCALNGTGDGIKTSTLAIEAIGKPEPHFLGADDVAGTAIKYGVTVLTYIGQYGLKKLSEESKAAYEKSLLVESDKAGATGFMRAKNTCNIFISANLRGID